MIKCTATTLDISLISLRDIASLLRQYSVAKNISQGREIHKHLNNSGKDRNTFLGNLLIQMYGNCGSTDEAYAAFQNISKRNVFSWNIMISALAQAGKSNQAYKFFQQMPQRDQVSWNAIIAAFAQAGDLDRMLQILEAMEQCGIRPNRLTFVTLLDAFQQDPLDFSVLENGKLIHGKISQHGLHGDLQIQTALIGMYDRLGSLGDAIAVFDRIDDPDVIAWNSLLSAFARAGDLPSVDSCFQRIPERNLASWSIAIAANLHCGQGKIAVSMFQAMDVEGRIVADRTILITALYACGQIQQLEIGQAIHDEIAVLCLESDVFSGTALIGLYSRCHRIDLARAAFDAIAEKNQVAWNAMITAYIHNGRLDLASHCLDRIPVTDVVSRTLVVADLAHRGRVREAREIFDGIPVRDIASWNAMISAHAANGEVPAALQLLAEMDLEGVEPDRGTFVAISDTHLSTDQAAVLQELVAGSTRCCSDPAVATALVSMHGRSARLAAARGAFDSAGEKNVVLWSAMLAVYAANGRSGEAVEVLLRMNLEGFVPNEVTFVSVLSACGHAGDLVDARRRFLEVAADFGVGYSREHYVCMADVAARSGEMEMAQGIVSEMPFVADDCSWKAVLAGCVVAGNATQAEQLVAGRLFEVGSNDPSSYIMLSNVYVPS